MEKVEKDALITRFNSGEATEAECKIIETLIANGELELTDLTDIQNLAKSVDSLYDPSPSIHLDDRFYALLAKEKRKAQGFSFSLPEWNALWPRLAFAICFTGIGLWIGYSVANKKTQSSVTQLTQEVGDLKEMMMLSLLEKESATERLKAVSLTNDMSSASKNVTDALIKTLNYDDNVNVRLSALDALRPYVKDSSVRMALIKSIGIQESPLVQVALAELMAALQEKKSLQELEQLLKRKQTPDDVKKKIQESIQVII
jgi:hypothetical protein